LTQPKFIKEALAAGKHVLSEKPIAPTAADAEALIQWYRKEIDTKKINWSVAENIRTLTRVDYAAEQARTMGRLLGFQAHELKFVRETAKYYSS
jgi:predicted dehydrogenase